MNGKFLGYEITKEQLECIKMGPGNGIKKGDYWIIDGKKYVVECFYTDINPRISTIQKHVVLFENPNAMSNGHYDRGTIDPMNRKSYRDIMFSPMPSDIKDFVRGKPKLAIPQLNGLKKITNRKDDNNRT